jgi:AcrR family transcriptional regulator
MSPRPKRAPDSHVIEAAARVVAERGAAATRLSDVAAAAGFAPATLIQRFGTRERLLQAVAEVYLGAIREAFANRGQSHVDSIGLGLLLLFQSGHLSFLLGYPASAPAYSLELRKWIGHLLVAAVNAGELPLSDVASYARRIQLAYYGLATAALLESDSIDSDAFTRLVRDSLADFL